MANKLVMVAACAALASVAVSAGRNSAQASRPGPAVGRKLGGDSSGLANFDWSGSDSSSGTGHWPTEAGDAPVGVDNTGAYHDRLVGLWSLEKILLKLIYKGFDTIDQAKFILENAPKNNVTYTPILTESQLETLYALEAKLTWIIKEACKVVFKIIKVAFGREDYAGYSFSSGRRELEALVQEHVSAGRQLWELPSNGLKYYPIFLPYWPKPWGMVAVGINLDCALAKLEGLRSLLYGLKGLAYRALQVIKAIKEELKVVDSATAEDWSASSSSSSSTHLTGSKQAALLAKLAHTEKWLGITFKEQVGFILKIKALAFATPCLAVIPPPCTGNCTFDR